MLTNMLLTGNWSLIRVRALSLTVIACINRSLFIAVFLLRVLCTSVFVVMTLGKYLVGRQSTSGSTAG